MNIRLKRLESDFQKLCKLKDNSEFITFDNTGNPPEKYVITFSCKGLAKLGIQPSITTTHKCEIYLHNEYPRKPPLITWLTNIFHPNILPPEKNGGVCIGDIGSWTPAESLDRLCIRIGEMVQYKNYNLNNPLNIEAAEWAKSYIDKFPVDNRELEKDLSDQKLVIEIDF